IDINIRAAADDPDDDTPDVGRQLKDRLPRDDQGRPYVDAFLLTHPDKDHCSGLQLHFHLGPIEEWSSKTDKIVIREMWSSPIVFRRASKNYVLCADANAWAVEARRRVRKFRSDGYLLDGDRILVLGEDIDGKTDDLTPILIAVDSTFARICGVTDGTFSALLLAPLPPADDAEEDVLSKNNSSVIIQLTLASGNEKFAAKYLFGGDAEVAIWERLWEKHKGQPSNLDYDVMVAPHHCSWHSLSWDSWSEKREDAKISVAAHNALSQAKVGAWILASSNSIKDDDNDPPCIRAKREYESILKPKSGTFRCLGDGADTDPLEFDVSWAGPKASRAAVVAAAGVSSLIGREALAHG
ncbi:MAG: metallohydrolase, partial [Rhodobacter sp.]|nr:metallohydrolase [Rhodobacter sp.]